jgi:hypothetical protein
MGLCCVLLLNTALLCFVVIALASVRPMYVQHKLVSGDYK